MKVKLLSIYFEFPARESQQRLLRRKRGLCRYLIQMLHLIDCKLQGFHVFNHKLDYSFYVNIKYDLTRRKRNFRLGAATS